MTNTTNKTEITINKEWLDGLVRIVHELSMWRPGVENTVQVRKLICGKCGDKKNVNN